MKEIKKDSVKNTTKTLDSYKLSNNKTNTKEVKKDGKPRIDRRKSRSEIDKLGNALVERIDRIVETKEEKDDEQKSKTLKQVDKIKQIVSKLQKKHGLEAKKEALKRQTKKKATKRVKATKNQSTHKQ